MKKYYNKENYIIANDTTYYKSNGYFLYESSHENDDEYPLRKVT